jgi:hypothetical protein
LTVLFPGNGIGKDHNAGKHQHKKVTGWGGPMLAQAAPWSLD